MGNVVIVTHWLDGDVIPFVRIGKELKKRGHSVTLITHCYFEEMAKKAGIGFRAWDTPEEYALLVEEMKQNKTGDSKANNYSYESNEFRQRYESIDVRLKEFGIVSECCGKPDTVILCKNRSSIAAYLVAEKYKLPLAVVMMNPTEVSSMLLYEQLEGKNDLPRLNELRKDVDLGAVNSWLQWESSAKMTLALWPKWYDSPDGEWPSEIEAVGFPFEDGKEAYKREIPAEFTEWLKHNPNPVVITGGTTKCINEKFYESSIAACGIAGYPTIVLSRFAEFIPKELPKNVKWFEYLPLDLILPYISVLIHHGGMGTLTGALAAGIPQLILPCYVDRPYNATLIKKLGAGDFLYPANWQPEKIAAMIGELQDEKVRENCRQYVLKMKSNSGITTVADRVEQMMKDKKFVYSINSEYRMPDMSSEKPQNTPRRENMKEPLRQLTQEQKARLLMNIRKREQR